MKTKLIKIAFVALAAISFSCTSDSDNSTQDTGMFLNKTEEFSPQQSGYTTRLVTYYQNNKKVCDTTFNNSGVMTFRKEYTRTSSTQTIHSYNAQNALISKTIYTYDSSKRITNVDSYNGQNALTDARVYVYSGNDINLYKVQNGSQTLLTNFKTNANNLVYLQESAIDGNTKTLSYNNNLPIELDNEGYVMPYEFYPNMKPQNLRNTANEINNAALLVVLDHVYLSCNYYLKKVNFPFLDSVVNYEKTFNSDNYITFQKTYSVTGGVNSNISEAFYYYNE